MNRPQYDDGPAPETAVTTPGDKASYVVVARRYRPQSFGELIGQTQVARALENAISTNRVGHAYLFTGARGVGKTSAARILAKTLNCSQGTAISPCQECDVCQSIAAGTDVDVIEIDGASNRGIDEIRQLRSSVGVRPSRSRFKIYIIDEVHMLTKEAFNALLKTLEEPPGHVKFVFCTTDPEKIPITVLSRCQRFDFPPIRGEEIVARLQEIVAAEGASADQAALELLARKAAGSMRDSQSLLEQLLSFSDGHITVEAIHTMLGTAGLEVVAAIIDELSHRNTAEVLGQLDAALQGGIDVGQLAEQLLGYVRDVLAAGVGCAADQLQTVPASDHERLVRLANAWSVPTVLNILQILDQAIVRMRYVLHRRTLVEMALVRICELENLTKLVSLAAGLEGAATTLSVDQAKESAPREKKTPGVSDASEAPINTRESSLPGPPGADSCRPDAMSPLTADTGRNIWLRALDELGGLDADVGRQFKTLEVAGKRLSVGFDTHFGVQRLSEDSRLTALRRILHQLTGTDVDIRITLDESARVPEPVSRKKAEWDLRVEVMQHPLVREAMELFDAELTRVQASSTATAATADRSVVAR